MAQNVIMPQMGESIAEGTITTWLKKVGDTVERDEALFEISTDKVDAEIPSPVAGVLLEIKVSEGTTVEIDTIVAVIGEAGESPLTNTNTEASVSQSVGAVSVPSPDDSAAETTAQSTASSAVVSVEERRRVKSSPVVRKIASQHGIDITQLTGTGISGRVTKQDIIGFVEGGQPSVASTSFSSTVASAPIAGTPIAGTPITGAPILIPAAYRPQVFEGDRVEEMSKMRTLIAEHMVFSKQVSPHVQTVFEVDFSHVAKLRKKYKPVWADRYGLNLTYTHFAIKAVVDALKNHPVLNSSIDGNRVIYHRDVNVGLAVALDWGLIVPVIHGAGELNLLGLAKRAVDLGTRAKEKKLKPDEVTKGTFTITNPGVFGNLFGIPVINQPQVAILGMGGIEKRPVVIDDMIAIRTRAYFSLSFDHRVVDGADADKFMQRVKQGIQEFDEAEL